MTDFAGRRASACRSSRRVLARRVVLLWVLGATTEVCAEVPPLVRVMLDNAPAGAETRCSYDRVRVDGDQTRRERYHARDVEHPWTLELVNGRPPSMAALRRYARGASDRHRRHPLTFDLRQMVDPSRWRLRSETDAEAEFEFRLRPTDALDRHLAAKVQGTLVVDKLRGQPVRIRIENTGPAYVAPLVRVVSYVQVLQFRWNDTIGASVLTRKETDVRGRTLGFSVIRKHKLVRYSHYRCAAEVAETAR